MNDMTTEVLRVIHIHSLKVRTSLESPITSFCMKGGRKVSKLGVSIHLVYIHISENVILILILLLRN